MESIELTIRANEPEQEILISLLSDYDAEGFQQTDTELVAYFKEINYKPSEIKQILEAYPYLERKIPDQNWNEVWERNFEPVRIGDLRSIRAEFHAFVPGTLYDIVVTPKMSFGTGHHATTYMMVEQMGTIDFYNKTVLDFGTGTGILAILAEKMGGTDIIAIDNDEWSITNAAENLSQNLSSKITIEERASLPQKTFDIILANINRNILISYLKQLKTRLNADGGLLLLSGILETDEEDLILACKELNLSLMKSNKKAGWVSLLFVNEKLNKEHFTKKN